MGPGSMIDVQLFKYTVGLGIGLDFQGDYPILGIGIVFLSVNIQLGKAKDASWFSFYNEWNK